MVAIGQSHGVFTLASGWQRKKDPGGDRESFEAFVRALSHLRPILDAAEAQAPKSKPKAGRILAEKTECPEPVDRLYAGILAWLSSAGMARSARLASAGPVHRRGTTP